MTFSATGDPANFDHILITPANATITADTGSQTYTAATYDSHGNPIKDVTAQTTFTIDGSPCSGAVCWRDHRGRLHRDRHLRHHVHRYRHPPRPRGCSEYDPAPQVDRSFTVTKGDQSVSFTSTNPSSVIVGASPYTRTANATSGLTPTIALDAGSIGCTLSGGVVNFTAVGICLINATQGGDTNWNVATPAQQSITIGGQSQTITFGAISDRRLDQSPFNVSATATPSGLTVSFTSATTSVCTVSGTNGKTVTLQTVGLCTIDADQGGNSTYDPASQVSRSFTVTKGNRSVSFTSTNPGSVIVGASPYTPTASATSGLTPTIALDAGSIGCTLDGGVVNFTAVGICLINATQGGDTNWNVATPAQQSITIGGQSQTITFGAISDRRLDQSPFDVSATATPSGLTVSFTSATTSVCTVSGTNGKTVTLQTVGLCTIDADQGGNSTYDPAPQVSRSFPHPHQPCQRHDQRRHGYPDLRGQELRQPRQLHRRCDRPTRRSPSMAAPAAAPTAVRAWPVTTP